MIHYVILYPEKNSTIYNGAPCCGRSGKIYGHTVYLPGFHCQGIELIEARYLEAIEDISKAQHLPNCRIIVRALDKPTDIGPIRPEHMRIMAAENSVGAAATATTTSDALVGGSGDRHRELMQLSKRQLRALLNDIPEDELNRLASKEQMVAALIAREQAAAEAL